MSVLFISYIILLKIKPSALIWCSMFFIRVFTMNLHVYTIPVGFTVQLGAPYEGETLVGVGSGIGTNSTFTTTGIIPPV